MQITRYRQGDTHCGALHLLLVFGDLLLVDFPRSRQLALMLFVNGNQLGFVHGLQLFDESLPKRSERCYMSAQGQLSYLEMLSGGLC